MCEAMIGIRVQVHKQTFSRRFQVSVHQAQDSQPEEQDDRALHAFQRRHRAQPRKTGSFINRLWRGPPPMS
jgi:hypothetical protein